MAKNHLTPEQQAALQEMVPKMGDVIYFRSSKKEPRRNAKEVKYQGHGFGVFLGHVPQHAPSPTPDDLFRLMGSIGFLTFDDVAEFLGEEAATKCVQAYENKFYGPEAEARAQEIPQSPLEAPERPKLVDMNGTPINSNNEAPLQEKENETTH